MNKIDPQEVIIKHLTKVEGVTREDILGANQEDPDIAKALIDAMEEYRVHDTLPLNFVRSITGFSKEDINEQLIKWQSKLS